MTTAELREATREFDKPLPLSKTKPISKDERVRLAKARQFGVSHTTYEREGVKPIVLHLDEGFLRQFDEYVIAHGLTREELVERGVRREMV